MSDWHQNPENDVPSRRIIIHHIVKLLEHCKPSAFSGKQEKLVDLARRLEVALYKDSKSKKEYLDTKTLRQRVRKLAQLSSAHQNAKAASSSKDGKSTSENKSTMNGKSTAKASGSSSAGNGSSNGTAAAASGSTQRTTLTTEQQRMRILEQRQRRLLLLRHASKCPLPKGKCKIPPCAEMKELWKHIAKCKDQKCTTPHCVSSRYVLSHYHRCKDKKCLVCAPVRKISEDQKKRRLQRQQEILSKQQKQGKQQKGKRGRKPGSTSQRKTGPKGRATSASQQLQQQQQLLLQRRQQHKHLIRPPADVIKKQYSRSCISGTGPSLPNYLCHHDITSHISMIKADRLYSICWPLLRKLMEHRNNRGIFNEPVDAVALNIPEYNKIIKKPMDLGTVRINLEEGKFESLKDFCAAVRLVFKNAKDFNPARHPVHEAASMLLDFTDAEIPKLEQKRALKGRKPNAATCPMCFQPQCETCPVCDMGCVTFEPRLLYCAKCEKKISRNAVYYAGVGYLYAWCHECYDRSRGDEVVACGGAKRFKKRDLIKKKNNELFGEPWVSCDDCGRWLHQTCALFNPRKNDEKWKKAPYRCPICIAKDPKKVQGDPSGKVSNDVQAKKEAQAKEAPKIQTPKNPPAKSKQNADSVKKEEAKSNGKSKDADAKKKEEGAKKAPIKRFVPAAKDLEHTRLGKFLENWVQKAMKDRLVEEKKNAPRVAQMTKCPDPSKTRIRILHNSDEKFKVEPSARSAHKLFPDQFKYRSRCIFLFQEQNGVDVLLFAMYVQEYGTDTDDPNKRKIYIAYLDSVHYFRPRRFRTLVYHTLLTAYLEYSRRRGFTSSYIWACPPPNKRDDYILHCHPEDQRVPSADRLRKWYHEMIRMANKEGTCVSSCPLYDEHFVQNAPKQGKGRGRKGRKGIGRGGRKSPTQSSKNGRGTRSNRRDGAQGASEASADADDADENGVEESKEEYFGPDLALVENGTFVVPGNGLVSSDPWTMPADVEKRKKTKLAMNEKMPYFKGDYWPQEAEEVSKMIEAEMRKEKVSPPKPVYTSTGRASRKRRRPGEETEVEEKERLEAEAKKRGEGKKAPKVSIPKEKLINKLKSQLELNRDNFLVVKLAHECARCGQYLIRGRWECRHPRCRKIGVDFNTRCPFALCNSCYIEEAKRPKEHQHGGGCIAPGDAGKPKDVEYIKKIDEGKDQSIVNIPHEQTEAFKKKRESLKASVIEKLRRRESEVLGKAAGTNAKDKEGKGKKGDVGGANVKANGEKKDADGDDVMTDAEKKKENGNDAKSKGQVKKEDTKDAGAGKTSKGAQPSSKTKSSEATVKSEKGQDKTKGKYKDIQIDRNLYQKELAPALAQLLKDFRAETKKAYHENLKMWDEQELKCTRVAIENDQDEDSHHLHFVDANMPVVTPFYDRPMHNQLLINRHAFLALCTGNRYQFDELRRAKHSTMMCLYHLHNPKAPAHLYTCNMCGMDILGQQRYHCDVCQGGDYDICRACYSKHGHEHKLIPIQITTGVDLEVNEAQRIQRKSEQRRARQRSLQLFLQALVHSSYCTKKDCYLAACRKMKELLQHRKDCAVRVRGGCEVCRRVLCLVQMHSKSCTKKNCQVPHCEDLKQHLAQQAKKKKAEERRRKAKATKAKRGSLKGIKATVIGGSGTKIKIRTTVKGSRGGGTAGRGRGKGRKTTSAKAGKTARATKVAKTTKASKTAKGAKGTPTRTKGTPARTKGTPTRTKGTPTRTKGTKRSPGKASAEPPKKKTRTK